MWRIGRDVKFSIQIKSIIFEAEVRCKRWKHVDATNVQCRVGKERRWTVGGWGSDLFFIGKGNDSTRTHKTALKIYFYS